jgi:uncharacterized protein (TIGR00106 family)
MKVTADFCIVPLGVGVSVGKYVAACERVLQEAGLQPQLHAHGTNVEGEWQAVFDGLQRCHQVVHELGAPRVHTTVRLGTRTDRPQRNADKVQSVRSHLGE